MNRLRTLLETRFSESELRSLCDDLEVDYESLPGSAKPDKARELIAFLRRRERLDDLLKVGSLSRPDIDWSGVVDSEQPSEPKRLEQNEVTRPVAINPLIPKTVVAVISDIDSGRTKGKWAKQTLFTKHFPLNYSRSYPGTNALTHDQLIKIASDGIAEVSLWVKADYRTIGEAGLGDKKYRMALARDEAILQTWSITKDILTENRNLFTTDLDRYKSIFKQEFRTRVLQYACSSLHELDGRRLEEFVSSTVTLYHMLLDFRYID